MNQREKTLLLLFAGCVAICGIAIGVDFFLKARRNLVSEGVALALQMAEVEVLLEEKTLWQERRQWLADQLPVFTSGKEIESALFEEIKSPAVAGIAVSDIKLNETEITEDFATTGATLMATGPLESVFLWIYGLQQPESFRTVEDLVVIPLKEDDSQVQCKFTLSSWYAL